MSLQKYKEARKKIQEALVEGCRLAREAFKEASTELFDKHPKLESFSWTQYTPYFNDGDECCFSVHYDCPDINGEYGYDLDEKNTDLIAAQRDCEKLIKQFDEEDMKAMFGDHVQVTVTRGSVETEGYNHD